MTIQRMEHLGVVVDDLAAATAFFVELGLRLQGEGAVEGGWVDRVVGLEGVRDDIDAVVARARAHGGELVGEVEQYEDSYRLCYVRGPEGIIVGLAERIGCVFVDCHSHVVPSGDDGAVSVEDGRALCLSAARHGTSVLFATPHVWPHLTLTDERERAVRAAFERVRAGAGLELRLGFELTPTRALLTEDPHRYLLEGTDRVLLEVDFVGPADLAFALGEHVERSGLRPVIAHS